MKERIVQLCPECKRKGRLRVQPSFAEQVYTVRPRQGVCTQREHMPILHMYI